MKIKYGLHMMWYEYAMIEDHFDSLQQAYDNAVKMFPEAEFEFVVVANYQTEIENCTDPDAMDRFSDNLAKCVACFDRDVDDSWNITSKHNEDDFYGIADFRREIREDDGWVVWGEVDCILPHNFFQILCQVPCQLEKENFGLTFAYRKMWDHTWQSVEHPEFQSAPYNKEHRDMVDAPFNFHDVITQDQLDQFNEKYADDIQLVRIRPPKIDGSLMAFYKLDPKVKLIPDEMHFSREDFIAQLAMDLQNIPQYHVRTIIKGHNYKHPDKRYGTDATREDTIYKEYEATSLRAGEAFLQKLARRKHDRRTTATV